MFRRIFFFILCNILVTATLIAVITMLGIQPYLTPYGLNLTHLAAFCLIWGMGGAFISLLLSRKMAKWIMRVKLVPDHHEIAQLTHSLARRAGLKGMPEVGIFSSNTPNAFATGPTQSRSLIAVSTGLVDNMSREEMEAIIGHEISHIKNGDMVTMTLLQGVVNAFVLFFARLLAYALTRSRKNNGSFYLFTFLFEMVFMLFGSMIVCWYSRCREFRADSGGAELSSRSNMISALTRLGQMHTTEKAAPASVRALMMRPTGSRSLRLFMTHPPLEERIRALSQIS
jgi:heat shock protein HtpX